MPVWFRTPLALAFLAALAGEAHAQFAVIDVASVTQLIEQLQTLEQQVSTAQSQLSQAQAEYQAITGARGMEQLLSGTTRNYLPTDWSALQAVAASGAYPALGGSVRAALGALSVLSPAQLATLSPVAAAQLAGQRRDAALLQGVTQQAVAYASSRFGSLQQLIDAIARASDQKAVLDLQARTAAEGNMLQNEGTKVQVMLEAVQADERANAQRARELIIAGHGQFAGRFQPRPPSQP